MPILLYCVTPDDAGETSVRGVGGAEVRSRTEGGFRFFYSAVAESHPTQDVATAARQVHEVVSDIFSQSPVLPFRYPTILADESEVGRLATTRGAAFAEYFGRVGTRVQMDIRLTLAEFYEENPHLPPSGGGRAGPPSGRAYLGGRAQRQATISAAAEKCRQTAHPADWRIQQRGENIRCQALMERVEVLSFLERMRTLELPGGVKAATSGPWPPAAFWENEPD